MAGGTLYIMNFFLGLTRLQVSIKKNNNKIKKKKKKKKKVSMVPNSKNIQQCCLHLNWIKIPRNV